MKNIDVLTVDTTAKRAVHHDARRTSLAIVNVSSTVTVYLGSDIGVTSQNGFPVYPGTSITFNKGLGDRPDIERYIVGDASAEIRIMEDYGAE
jgi:hypothetical protein